MTCKHVSKNLTSVKKLNSLIVRMTYKSEILRKDIFFTFYYGYFDGSSL
jgi:hypothetical protein